MDCKYQLKDGCMRISMPKEVDHHNAEQLKKEADLLIGAYHIQKLIFDFAGTEFMDSSGIGLVMGRYRLIREWNGSVEIHNPAPSIKKVMRLAGLDRIASIHSSPPKSGTNSTKTEAKI